MLPLCKFIKAVFGHVEHLVKFFITQVTLQKQLQVNTYMLVINCTSSFVLSTSAGSFIFPMSCNSLSGYIFCQNTSSKQSNDRTLHSPLHCHWWLSLALYFFVSSCCSQLCTNKRQKYTLRSSHSGYTVLLEFLSGNILWLWMKVDTLLQKHHTCLQQHLRLCINTL